MLNVYIEKRKESKETTDCQDGKLAQELRLSPPFPRPAPVISILLYSLLSLLYLLYLSCFVYSLAVLYCFLSSFLFFVCSLLFLILFIAYYADYIAILFFISIVLYIHFFILDLAESLSEVDFCVAFCRSLFASLGFPIRSLCISIVGQLWAFCGHFLLSFDVVFGIGWMWFCLHPVINLFFVSSPNWA